MRHRKVGNRIVAAVFAALLLLTVARVPVAAQPTPAAPEAVAALNWLRAQQNADGGFPGFGGPMSDPGDSADAALAFLSADISPDAVRREGGASLRDYLRATATNLNMGQAAKVVLVAAATGDEPLTFGGGVTYSRMLTDYRAGVGASNFVNALVILAVAATEGAARARQVDEGALAGAQGDDGGWSFSRQRSGSDTNTSALVVQALIASGQGGETTRGIAYLDGTRQANDLYPFDEDVGEGDANSTAYVLQAKVAARADPAEIERTRRALRTLQRPSGAFNYQVSMPGENLLATVQAIPALNGRAFPAVRPAAPLPLPVAA